MKETGKVFVELDKMPDRGRCSGDAELCPVVGLQPVNSQGAGSRQTKVFVFENSHGAPLSVALDRGTRASENWVGIQILRPSQSSGSEDSTHWVWELIGTKPAGKTGTHP